jgi:hypothetical protein
MPISTNFSAAQSFNPPPALWQMSVNNSQAFTNPGCSLYMSGGDGNPTNTNWASWYPGSGDFCIETWAYFTGIQATTTIWTLGGLNVLPSADLGLGLVNNSATYGADGVHWQLAASLQGVTGGNGTIINPGDVDPLNNNFILQNTWNHLAMTRQSGTLNLWVNGTLSYTTSFSASITNPSSTSATIGMFGVQAVSRYNGGYIEYDYTGNTRNTRYTVGSGVYTGTFTPPNIASFLPPLSGTYYNMAPMVNSGDISFDPGSSPYVYTFTNEIKDPTANYAITSASYTQTGDASTLGAGITYYSAG